MVCAPVPRCAPPITMVPNSLCLSRSARKVSICYRGRTAADGGCYDQRRAGFILLLPLLVLPAASDKRPRS